MLHWALQPVQPVNEEKIPIYKKKKIRMAGNWKKLWEEPVRRDRKRKQTITITKYKEYRVKVFVQHVDYERTVKKKRNELQ